MIFFYYLRESHCLLLLVMNSNYMIIAFFVQACFDVREAVVFWATMRMLTEMNFLPPEKPWISTHPSHGDRERNLNEAMAKALQLRKDSGVRY